jgi:hypothetical protein
MPSFNTTTNLIESLMTTSPSYDSMMPDPRQWPSMVNLSVPCLAAQIISPFNNITACCDMCF